MMEEDPGIPVLLLRLPLSTLTLGFLTHPSILSLFCDLLFTYYENKENSWYNTIRSTSNNCPFPLVAVVKLKLKRLTADQMVRLNVSVLVLLARGRMA